MNPYQIAITHHPGTCPTLPDGFHYETYEQDSAPWQCPQHTVLPTLTRIADIRRAVGQLRQVQDLKQIAVYHNEQQRYHESWHRNAGQWERD